MSSTNFAARHIGPVNQDVKEMLSAIGVKSIDELIDQTVPGPIRNQQPLSINSAMSEHDYLGMTGYEKTPVIMVTGMTGGDNAARALETGADDFMSKPISPREFKARALKLIRK